MPVTSGIILLQEMVVTTSLKRVWCVYSIYFLLEGHAMMYIHNELLHLKIQAEDIANRWALTFIK